MTQTDRAKFAEVIAALAVTFGRDCDEPMLYGYWLGLDDLPLDGFLHACRRALRECHRMPAVAELRSLAGDAKDSDRALLAWSALEQAVGRYGAYKSPAFDDPIIHATIRNLGGWERCCELSHDEFDTWLRKEFLRTYEAFCRTGVSPDAAAPLVGSHDRTNGLLGYNRSAVVQVETGLPAKRFSRPAGAKLNGVPRLEFKRP